MSFDPMTAILDVVGKVIDRIIPDPAQKAAAVLQLAQLQQTGELAQLTADTNLMLAQTDVNKVEAANSNLFVSGWRPFIGWVCGASLGWTWVVAPFAQWAFQTKGLPALPPEAIYPVLMGMLGLSVSRTVEKVKGVA